MIQRVPFGNAGQRFLFLFGKFISVADNSLTSYAGKDTVLNNDLVCLSLKQMAAASGIFSLAVFPNEDHIYVLFFYFL